VLSQKNNVIPFVVNTPSGPTVDIARFQANGAPQFVIQNNGNVGIGTTSPTSSNGNIGKLVEIAAPGTALSNANSFLTLSTGDAANTNICMGLEARSRGSRTGSDKRFGQLGFFPENTNTTSGFFTIYTNNGGSSFTEKLRITGTGNVGIGTTNPASFKLAVEGKIGAREVVVTTATWSDFVFKKNYKLKPLDEVENYIKTNKHLEGIPTEKEVKAKGVAMGDMQARLLQKVEELTLYTVELNKKTVELNEKVNQLTLENKDLNKKINEK
jgi:hypothetical protein